MIRPKGMKKGGKKTHLPVEVRSTREKMTSSDVSALYTIAWRYGVASCVTFSYPGGYSFIFFYSRCVKEWFVAQ